MAQLEAAKAEAVEAEDYGRAKELKGLIDSAKAGEKVEVPPPAAAAAAVEEVAVAEEEEEEDVEDWLSLTAPPKREKKDKKAKKNKKGKQKQGDMAFLDDIPKPEEDEEAAVEAVAAPAKKKQAVVEEEAEEEADEDDWRSFAAGAGVAEEEELKEGGEALESKVRRERPAARVQIAESSQPGMVSMRLDKVSVYFKNQEVLKDATWEVRTGDRIGLVGANGCGKSTQVRMMAGEIEATSGDIIKSSKDLRTAFLKQEFRFVRELIPPYTHTHIRTHTYLYCLSTTSPPPPTTTTHRYATAHLITPPHHHPPLIQRGSRGGS